MRNVRMGLGFTGLIAVMAGALQAQTVTLDEGTYRLMVGGQEAGTETFSIRRNGGGDNAVIIATGKVVLDTARLGQQINADLQVAGPALRPAAYQVKIEGQQAQQIAGRVAGGRFSARIVSSAGEMMREYLASEGAVVVDEGVAHHYYFLAQRIGTAGARVPMIFPRQSRQVTAQVSASNAVSLTIGGSAVKASRFAVTVAGEPERQVWVDEQGRVLRLEIPARNFIAERTAAPR